MKQKAPTTYDYCNFTLTLLAGVIAMDNIQLPRKTCTSLTSILKFKVPPYSNVSRARCHNQLLEGDRKLHFELRSEIRGRLQRVTRSALLGTLFDSFMY